MDPDAAVKLILATSVGFSLVIISFQISRIFGVLADVLKDFRRVVQNLGTASDMFLSDYEQIHKIIANLTKALSGLAGLFAPITALMAMLDRKNQKSKEPSPEEI
jgi:ABC-type transporter Mla subunit MlaD